MREGVRYDRAGNTVTAASASRRRDRRRRRRERRSRRRRSGSAAGNRPRRRVRGERPVPDAAARALRAPARCVELGDIPGGYGWVFPKGDHANVGVGGWQSEGPRIREHLAARLRGARPRPAALESLRGHRLPLRRPGTRIAGERALARRRRRRADRPGLGRRHVRVLRLVAARGRRDPRPARRARLDARALRGGGRRRARAAPPGLVEAEAGARPLAARLVAVARTPARLAEHRAAAARASSSAPGEQRGVARVPLRALELLGRVEVEARVTPTRCGVQPLFVSVRSHGVGRLRRTRTAWHF